MRERYSRDGDPPFVFTRCCAAVNPSDGPAGNPHFLRMRYDEALQDQIRRSHAREAVLSAPRWAAKHQYVVRCEVDWQGAGGAGFDLLFIDAFGTELQVEVKGYRSRNLANVHLQPSQAQRASDAAGHPPDWRLYALLGAGSVSPDERVLTLGETVALLRSGVLKVKRW